MPDAYLSLSESAVVDFVRRIKMDAHDERKRRQKKALDYYEGEGFGHTQAALREGFVEWQKYQVVPLDLTTTMIDERAMLYKDPAARKLVDPLKPEDPENPDPGLVEQNRIAGEMWSQMQMNSVMKVVERRTLLQRTIIVKPTWVVLPGGRGQMRLDIIGPESCDVIQARNDATRAEAILYSIGYVDTVSTDPTYDELRYCYWDAKSFRIFNGKGEQLANPENPGNENPFGIIWTTFRDGIETSPRFWRAPREGLVEMNEALNLAVTDVLHGLRMQLWGVPFITGSNLPAVIAYGPDKALRVQINDPDSTEPKFSFVTPTNNLESALKVLDWCLRTIARMNKMNPAAISLEGALSSGFALRIRDLPKIEDRSDRVEIFRTSELEFFDACRIVWNKMNPARKLRPDLVLAIDFAEPNFPADPKEELDLFQREAELGLVNVLDEIRRRNPDLKTNEDAEARLLENIRVRDLLKAKGASFAGGLGFDALAAARAAAQAKQQGAPGAAAGGAAGAAAGA